MQKVAPLSLQFTSLLALFTDEQLSILKSHLERDDYYYCVKGLTKTSGIRQGKDGLHALLSDHQVLRIILEHFPSWFFAEKREHPSHQEFSALQARILANVMENTEVDIQDYDLLAEIVTDMKTQDILQVEYVPLVQLREVCPHSNFRL